MKWRDSEQACVCSSGAGSAALRLCSISCVITVRALLPLPYTLRTNSTGSAAALEESHGRSVVGKGHQAGTRHRNAAILHLPADTCARVQGLERLQSRRRCVVPMYGNSVVSLSGCAICNLSIRDVPSATKIRMFDTSWWKREATITLTIAVF